jgi:hypothetical protein
MRGACRHGGLRAWEARPRRRPPLPDNTGFGGQRPPSSASGGVYESQIDDDGPRSGPRGLRSGLVIFLLLKIDLYCRLTAADIKMDHLLCHIKVIEFGGQHQRSINGHY